MQIAIIGAGLAGLECARRLLAAGHHVVAYEKSRGPGGRASTRETELGGFDYGAQYFTCGSERFKKEVAAWRKAGWVEQWDGKLVTLNRGKTEKRPAGLPRQRMVGVPGMGSLAQQLAHGLDLRTELRVTRIEPYGKQWLLRLQSDTVPIEASAGPFDAVLVALPADLAAPVLQGVPELAAPVAEVRLAPCWSLILGFQQALGLGYDGAWVRNSRLAWIAQDASKPQRRPGEHWVAHATVAWSVEHLEDDPERAKEKLLKAFHEATGSQVQPVYAAAHRWRFAQATQPVAEDCWWDAARRIGVCGDWFAAGLEGGGRIENACLSGAALAQKVMNGFPLPQAGEASFRR